MRYQWPRGLTKKESSNPPWRKASIRCWVPAHEQTADSLLCLHLGYWLIVKINRIDFLCIIWGLLSYLHLENIYWLQCALHFWKQNRTAFPNSRCFFPRIFLISLLPTLAHYSSCILCTCISAAEWGWRKTRSSVACFGFKFTAINFVGLSCCGITFYLSLLFTLPDVWRIHSFSPQSSDNFTTTFAFNWWSHILVYEVETEKSFRKLSAPHPFACMFACGKSH